MLFVDPYELVRVVCVVVALFCLVLIVMLYPWWARQTRAVRFMLLSNLIFTTVSAYGVTESLLLNIPGGSRSVATLVSLLYCAIGLILGLRDARLEEKKESTS